MNSTPTTTTDDILFTKCQAQRQRRLRKTFLLLLIQCLLIGSSAFVTDKKVSFITTRRDRQLFATPSKSGAKIITSTEEFSKLVLGADLKRPVMVFYTAPWCGPCRLATPVVKEVMKQFSGQLDAYEVCTDDVPDVASDSDVVSIPTIQMYCKGELMDTIVGCVAKSVLANAVTKVIEDAGVRFGVGNSTNGEDQ